MKEIGGYFGLEDFVHNEYYPDLIHMNLGRTALLYLLSALRCKKILLPYFLCDSVTERCVASDMEVEFYSIDRDLIPQMSRSLTDGEYIYLVNYYGQLSDEAILSYKKKYKNIIVDHTHSFFQRPLSGIPTIYSCRKYFGLPDGAYLSADIPDAPTLPMDKSRERMEHILGRYEGNASDYYHIMLEHAAAFHKEPPKSMSRLTRNLLNAIDYEAVRKKRNENYDYLHTELHSFHALSFIKPDGPFTYPFYSKHAPGIRKALAARNIYIPVYWSNILKEMAPDTVEYDYSAHILPLPCDQRYGTQELYRLVTELKSCLKEYGE